MELRVTAIVPTHGHFGKLRKNPKPFSYLKWNRRNPNSLPQGVSEAAANSLGLLQRRPSLFRNHGKEMFLWTFFLLICIWYLLIRVDKLQCSFLSVLVWFFFSDHCWIVACCISIRYAVISSSWIFLSYLEIWKCASYFVLEIIYWALTYEIHGWVVYVHFGVSVFVVGLSGWVESV